MTDTASGSGGGLDEGASGVTSITIPTGQEPSESNSTPAAASVATASSTTATVGAASNSASNVTVERQNSTSSIRSESDRLFPFLESGRRQIPQRALTMFQELVRNNVSIGIPNLSSSSAAGAESLSGTERERLAHRNQSDTQIMIPSSSGHALASASMSTPALGNPHRARGSSSSPSSQFRRNSGEDTGNGENSGIGSATLRGDRETLVLDIESGGGGGSWSGNDNGAEGGRRPEDGGARRTPPSGSETPREGEGTPNQGDRSPAEILRDSPETRAFIAEINRYTTLRPFTFIMILKGLLDHGSGIVCFLAMVVTFSHANSLLKKEVSKQRKRNVLFLAMIAVNLMGCAGFIYYVFSDEELYYALIFMNTKVDLSSFWMLMWVVGVTDYVAKFAAIIAKAFIVGFPTALLPFQKRGKYYLFIEQTSQLYRSFLPAHHWLLYLIYAYEGNMKMFGLIMAAMYTIFKATDSVQRFKDWNSAFQKLLQNVHYGTTPTAKELDSVGTVCPICHDIFTCPTRLSCTHIFCEECVSTWFDRERTCPMCRAKVVDDPTYRDGSTSQYIQFF